MLFRTKTILGVALIEAVLLAVLVGGALSILRHSNEDELIRRVQLGGKLLAAAAKDAMISHDLATLDSLVTEAMASGQIAFVRLIDADGTVLAERGEPDTLARPFHQESRIDQVIDGIFDWSVPVLAGGIRHGEVQLGVSTRQLNVLLASTLRWAAGIAALGMLFAAWFSWLLGGYLTRQLVALRAASQRLAAGDSEYRVPVKGNDELAQTALAFNSMAVATHLAQQRQRLANAELQRFAEVTAHHLQEPVRRMASYAERLISQLAGRIDDADSQLSLGFIGQQARRLKNLLGDIERYLAADQPRGKFEKSDARKTVTTILERLAKPIAEAGAVITVGELPQARIDAPRLNDLFAMALNNALSFGTASSSENTVLHIAINGERQGPFVRYSVSDNGPGIPKEYRERVFRVFERLSSDGPADSTGIGLAIVRRIAQSCDGSAWIEETPGGGCRLLFELPAEENPE